MGREREIPNLYMIVQLAARCRGSIIPAPRTNNLIITYYLIIVFMFSATLPPLLGKI